MKKTILLLIIACCASLSVNAQAIVSAGYTRIERENKDNNSRFDASGLFLSGLYRVNLIKHLSIESGLKFSYASYPRTVSFFEGTEHFANVSLPIKLNLSINVGNSLRFGIYSGPYLWKLVIYRFEPFEKNRGAEVNMLDYGVSPGLRTFDYGILSGIFCDCFSHYRIFCEYSYGFKDQQGGYSRYNYSLFNREISIGIACIF